MQASNVNCPEGERLNSFLFIGKHVLSEKPIHNSLKQGKSLIDTYSKSYADRGLHWRVAENFECEPAILKARDVIRDGTIGDVSFFRLSNAGYIDEEASKYYK